MIRQHFQYVRNRIGRLLAADAPGTIRRNVVLPSPNRGPSSRSRHRRGSVEVVVDPRQRVRIRIRRGRGARAILGGQVARWVVRVGPVARVGVDHDRAPAEQIVEVLPLIPVDVLDQRERTGRVVGVEVGVVPVISSTRMTSPKAFVNCRVWLPTGFTNVARTRFASIAYAAVATEGGGGRVTAIHPPIGKHM